jgi:hypothetical protein
MEDWRRQLDATLRGPGTRQLLAQRNGRPFWPGTLPTGDERPYSTALALNALLDIWTIPDGPHADRFHWAPDTPPEVKAAVIQGSRWLYRQLTSFSPSWDNACFSGSIKGIDTVPFLFPMNVSEQYGNLRIHGVRGIMPDAEFQRVWARCQAMASRQLGLRTKTFTYWTSPTVTKALCLLTFAKYQALNPSAADILAENG